MMNENRTFAPIHLEKRTRRVNWEKICDGGFCILFGTAAFVITFFMLSVNSKLFLPEASRTFAADLINQTAIQDIKGDYIVAQNFSFQPLPLMECNSYARNMTLNYIPAIEPVYYLDLTVHCQRPNIYPAWSALLFHSLLFWGLYFCLKFFSSLKSVNIFSHIMDIYIAIMVVLIISNLIVEKNNVPNPKLGKIDIISEKYYLTETFNYCHHLTANITDGVITCYNQSYIGECYQTYTEALEGRSDGETYFNRACQVKYFPNNKYIDVSFIFYLMYLFYVFKYK